MRAVSETMDDARGAGQARITIVEAQRRTKVYGPDLMRAVVDREIPSVRGARGIDMVHLADIEAWAARQRAV